MSRKPMKTATGMAVAIAVAVTGATLAQVSGAAAAVQADKSGEDKSRRVCRTVTPSGSRLVRRVCRSQADWDSTQQKAQDGVFESQMRDQTLFEQAPGPMGTPPPR
jgi:hypothetical protein